MTATRAKPFDDHENLDDADGVETFGDDSPEPDYFAVLGVTPAATPAELRQAYRRLAKLWHPDRYVNASAPLRAQAERRMRALTRAYAALSDPVQRSMYALRRTQRDSDDGSQLSGGSRPHATTYQAYGAWSGNNWQDEANTNPNGAGMFFGLLALVIGLGLALSAFNGSTAAPLLVGALTLLVALALAAALFTKGTPLARAANAWIEREPRGFADPYVAQHASSYASRAHRRRTASTATATTEERRATSPAGAGPTPRATTPIAHDLPREDADQRGDPDDSALTTQRRPDGALITPEEVDEADAARFARYVAAAVGSLPAEFRRRMPNVIVRVADEPDADTLRKMCVSNGQTLFGLYEGVPLTQQGASAVNPEVITLYRRPIERTCNGDQARLRKQIRKTVFHEVAHHFGISHEEMPDWVR